MEGEFFLERPQKYIRLMSWNVNSVRTKLVKDNVMEMMQYYDIVSLNEIKTSLPVLFPGYVSYISCDKDYAHRGGTCVLIKQHLNRYVLDVDVSIVDQVWFRLACVPGVLFGCCYVPPPDSPYYDQTSFSSMQAKIKENRQNKCLIIGDINTRFGITVRDLPMCLEAQHLSYPDIPDPVRSANDNAIALFGICVEENMAVVNNLKSQQNHFKSNLTYRQGREWVSELDTCVISSNMIDNISSFQVHQIPSLPSDHAPITVEFRSPLIDLEGLMYRASVLGDHAVLHNTVSNSLKKKPISFNSINQEKFKEIIAQQPPFMLTDDIHADASQLCTTLYECAQTCRMRPRERDGDPNTDRWERLLQSGDEAQVWRAINWAGELNDSDSHLADASPTDGEFIQAIISSKCYM